MNIGSIIKNGRIKKGMTRKQMAKALGVTTGALAHWENGIRYPSVRDFVRLAQMLEIVSEVFPEYSPKQNQPDLTKKMSMLEEELSNLRGETQKQKNSIHILVLVEDSLSYISMAEAISIFGYLVVQAKTKDEAWKILKHNTSKIALVIVDLEFPGIEGMNFFKLLKKHNEFCEIPTILYVEKSRKELSVSVEETGVMAVIPKPFDIFKLSKVIDKMNLEWQLKSHC